MVGEFVPLQIEPAAAEGMLDKRHQNLPQDVNDANM
jgi:hypothetical protein